MATFYLVLIIILFLLAISDLVVGVSNDAVNFLNSAVGAKAANFKLIMAVAALGILFGATFSSGMMEVARKGIFHPEFFYFSDLIVVFLAVMITDVILLDTFNTFGMPTSTTVSIVFELLGAAVAVAAIKVFTDPDALQLYEYINSAKALAIISGILLSVVIAFSAGVIIQYLSRLLFSFDYDKKLNYFGGIWGGIAIAAITYFILIKGSKGAGFMSSDLKASIADNSFYILLFSFIAWTVILTVAKSLFKLDILKFIVLFGTFALAMAFAGNDLVNFIGVPLAGYNSYQLFMESGATGPDSLLMDGLAGKVPTPTYMLLIAGLIMVITLWTSKKARSVVQTSLDLGRQDEGSERFSSFVLSRRIVRNFANAATFINNNLPTSWRNYVNKQFDQKPFTRSQVHKGKDAPSFDMIRASVTLVVASILITIGTNLKLPLSTTYVTFMVFMGTSLADGAWGRESAVYRVSGVLSVIGGWFFTAFSAFTVAFLMAILFYYTGIYGIIGMIFIAALLLYRTHRYHSKIQEEGLAVEKSLQEGPLTKSMVIDLSTKHISDVFGKISNALDKSLDGLGAEDLGLLSLTSRDFKKTLSKTAKLKNRVNRALDKIPDEEIETAHMYVLVIDYIKEMTAQTSSVVDASLNHIDNNHKGLTSDQISELKSIHGDLKEQMKLIIEIYKSLDETGVEKIQTMMRKTIKDIRNVRKNQIKRIKNREVGTRNSQMYLNILGEFRNLTLFSSRLVRVYNDLILNPTTETLVDPEEDLST